MVVDNTNRKRGAEMGQHGMAELAQQGSASWASTAWPSWAELCLLAARWGSLGVAATMPKLSKDNKLQ